MEAWAEEGMVEASMEDSVGTTGATRATVVEVTRGTTRGSLLTGGQVEATVTLVPPGEVLVEALDLAMAWQGLTMGALTMQATVEEDTGLGEVTGGQEVGGDTKTGGINHVDDDDDGDRDGCNHDHDFDYSLCETFVQSDLLLLLTAVLNISINSMYNVSLSSH